MAKGAEHIDFGLEMVGAGLAVVDQRKIDYGEASKTFVDAQNRALENKVGLWSLHQEKKEVGYSWTSVNIRLFACICSFTHFLIAGYFQANCEIQGGECHH